MPCDHELLSILVGNEQVPSFFFADHRATPCVWYVQVLSTGVATAIAHGSLFGLLLCILGAEAGEQTSEQT